MVFSKDGNRFAWTNGNVVRMVTWHNESKTWKDSVIGHGLERTTYMKFSPLGNILATWEIYAKREGMKPEDMHNLRLWCSVSGKLLHAITQRKSEGWCPQWTDDEVFSISRCNVSLNICFQNKTSILFGCVYVYYFETTGV